MEFGVVRVVSRDAQGLVIDGRCYQSELRVGGIFTLLYEVPLVDDGDTLRSEGRVNHQDVTLRVDRIEAYRREIEFINRGMTARLTLSGSGCDLVREGLVLGDG
jgi:hypothetical protein